MKATIPVIDLRQERYYSSTNKRYYVALAQKNSKL